MTSSNEEQYEFSDELVCAEYFKERIYPVVADLKVEKVGFDNGCFAQVRFKSTKGYRGGEVRTRFNGILVYVLPAPPDDGLSSFPDLCGVLLLNENKLSGINEPLFRWGNIGEMVHKIEELKFVG